MTGAGKKQCRQKMSDLLEEFHVAHVRERKGTELSGGERRRVEIARCLALEPKFILLDEPFAGVDPIAVADIQGIIEYLRKRGIGILITDHNVRETLRIVDRAYILNNGEILLEGDRHKIANDELAKKFYLGDNFTL
jgi:lipopolysaccharide export system ATP-binding protein